MLAYFVEVCQITATEINGCLVEPVGSVNVDEELKLRIGQWLAAATVASSSTAPQVIKRHNYF